MAPTVRVEEGRLESVRGSSLKGDAMLGGLIFAGQPLGEAVHSGKPSISGNRRLVERFLRLFKMPEPVPPAGMG